MNEHLGFDGSGFPPGHDRAQLVLELGRFLTAWGQILRAPSAPPPQGVADLQRVSIELQTRSRAIGFGGIAHHLARCSALVGAGAPFEPTATTQLREALGAVSELAWQARQELAPAEQAAIGKMLAPSAPPGAPSSPAPAAPPALGGAARAPSAMGSDLAPPPMLTIFPSKAPGASSSATPPPVNLPTPQDSISYPRAAGPGPSPGPQPASMGSPVPPPPLSAVSPAISPGGSAPAAGPLGMPAISPGLSAPAPVGATLAEAGRSAAFGRPEPAGVPAPRRPEGPARPEPPPGPGAPSGVAAPKLLVRSMLGLRAFDRKGSEPDPVAASAPPKVDGGSLLGLRPVTSARAAPAPPAPVDLGSMLRSRAPEPDRGVRSRAPRESTSERPPEVVEHPTAPRRATARRAGPGRGRRPSGSSSGWLVGALVALGLLGGVIALVLVVGRARKHSAEAADDTSPAASGSALAASGAPAKALPESRLLNEDERFRALVAQMHGHGGKESPELRALVDEQAALQGKFVGQTKCEGDPQTCAASAKARDLLLGPSNQIPIKRRPTTTPDQLRPKWMAGLAMPDLAVADDARVQRVFEYFTDNQVGRERFQAMLFRCGAYRDVIQATLIRYDVPPSLLAVVFTESGCDPLAKSPVGARGLWQFMPDAGRAYHLRIIEDALDERLSPPKETEAAVHFLNDLYQKFGSWELAFAAYNMGPFGLLARIERAEPGVTFWDLADAGVLPDETAGYVPQIEAFALILANLQKLKFAGSQMRAPEVTADLEVPPGTRLGLVARAAATSVLQIRALNLDVVGDRIPSVPGERFAVQVPKDVVWQARETLEGLIAQRSSEDQCVPDNFDWGKQRFTPEMAADCRKRLAAPLAPAQ